MSEDLGYESRLVRESARRYVDQRCPIPVLRKHVESGTVGVLVRETWAEIAAMQWPSILSPDPVAGTVADSGAGTVDPGRLPVMAALAEELGAGLYPGPVLSTAVVGHAVALSGSDDLRAEYLPRLESGEATAAVVCEADATGQAAGLAAERTPHGLVLSGIVPAVPNGPDAEVLLVPAATDLGPAHVLLPAGAPGVRMEPLDSLDLTRPFARFEVDGVTVAPHAVLATGRAAEDLMTLLACAETIGAAQRTFEFTLQYAKTRVAFGKPIGAFQVIKHRLAEMLLSLEGARAAVDEALAGFGSDSVFGRHGAAIAKLYAAQRLPLLARECLQIHGGIGFTWEHDMHLYLRRIESNAVLWGSPDRLADRLAAAMGLPAGTEADREATR